MRKRRLVLTDEDVAGGVACKEPECAELVRT